ncbi:hypothetical protein JJ691_63380 [Kutzneria sp. CA-103260]|nr:hypothetical protein JJ691_63380 [Kutzneria sp. CA-103260]
MDIAGYMAIRFAFIGGAVVLVVLGLFAVALVLRRMGKLNRARDLVEPVLREQARRRGGLTNMLVERVTKERR